MQPRIRGRDDNSCGMVGNWWGIKWPLWLSQNGYNISLVTVLNGGNSGLIIENSEEKMLLLLRTQTVFDYEGENKILTEK